MNHQAFDDLTERAARNISRRASLLTLGAAGVTSALSAPISADAKKNKRNKNKKKCKKKCPKPEELCAPQVEDCRLVVSAVCGDEPGCDHLIDCCETFASCDVGTFLACLNTPPVRP